MVPRYARPAMTALWEPEARFAIWFEIEAHATDKLGELGVVPVSAGKALWDWWATKPAMRPLEVSHRRGWIVAAALSLLLLFGGAASSAVWRRRSPREPLDPIELELQQMLEDERVRQTLTCEPPNPAESFASVER